MESLDIPVPENPLVDPEDERKYVKNAITTRGHKVLDEVESVATSSPDLFPISVSTQEAEGLAVDLVPEEHDDKVLELAKLAKEKGVVSALKVLKKMQDAHLTDDFHRYLVEYSLEGKDDIIIADSSEIGKELGFQLFRILITKSEKPEEKNIEELLASMEQLYSNLVYVDSNNKTSMPYLALEVVQEHNHSEPTFYIAVSDEYADSLSNHLLASFPDAQIEHMRNDHNIFVDGGEVSAHRAILRKNPIYPLKTYEDIKSDTMAPMLAAFSKIKDTGEGACVQFVINPKMGKRTQEKYIYALKKYRELGFSLSDAINVPRSAGEATVKAGVGFMKGVGSLFVNGSQSEYGKEEVRQKEKEEKEKVDEKVVEELQKKIDYPLFETNVRVFTSAGRQKEADAIAQSLTASFHQFSKPTGNALSWQRLDRSEKKKEIEQFIFRRFDKSTALPLSTRELASMLHFHVEALSPQTKLKRLDFRTASAPSVLPDDGVLLGLNSARGIEREVRFSTADRLRHLYTIGQTGTGKSTFLKNMIIQDIKNGNGCGYIDPHGNDIQDILAAVPQNRWKDVIYFDPSYTERVIGLNMLEYDESLPEQKTFVVNELFSIFQKLYGDVPESMGPMFEQYFRNATLLVLDDPESGSTLLDVSRVLSDEEYRTYKLSKCKNVTVKQFWEKIASQAGGEASLQNIVPYITSKFDVFLANDIMRPIVAQQQSSLDFRNIMDTKKIFLINLSKGKLGDNNAHLLGLIIVGKMLMAALSRTDVTQDFAPFYLYIDEFQNVTTPSISTILSEARKYKLSLTMAHQFIDQLDDKTRESVFGNVGSMVSFRIGTEDAEKLENRFSPQFTPHDLSNIANYNAYVKMLINGHPAPAFNIKVPPPDGVIRDDSSDVIELSHHRYGVPREEIEEMIRKRYL
jgi:hypothetical protein